MFAPRILGCEFWRVRGGVAILAMHTVCIVVPSSRPLGPLFGRSRIIYIYIEYYDSYELVVQFHTQALVDSMNESRTCLSLKVYLMSHVSSPTILPSSCPFAAKAMDFPARLNTLNSFAACL